MIITKNNVSKELCRRRTIREGYNKKLSGYKHHLHHWLLLQNQDLYRGSRCSFFQNVEDAL